VQSAVRIASVIHAVAGVLDYEDARENATGVSVAA
jgi:hypothetical protein